MNDPVADVQESGERPAFDHERPTHLPLVDFTTDPEVVRVVVVGERLAYGHFFNPASATEISMIDPLPHQRTAV